MIVYRAVPYLLGAAPPLIVLLAFLISGCTMTRTVNDPLASATYYSDPSNREGQELVKELDRRAAREEMRRLVEKTAK